MTVPFRACCGLAIGIFSAAFLLVACGDDRDGEIPLVSYEYQTFYQETENCAAPDSLCAHIILEYPMFTAAASEGVVEKLNDTVEALIISSALEPTEIDSVPEVITQFLTGYTETAQEFEDYWIAWSQQISVDVKGDTAGIICLALSRHEYTGGAHPNSELTFHNLDTRTAKPVAFDEVLIPGMQDTLRVLAEEGFREQHNLAPTDNLGEAGFWFEAGTFSLTDNICIGTEGITFFYNPYEVAPYAAGPTEIFLDYEQLEGIVDLNRRLSE